MFTCFRSSVLVHTVISTLSVGDVVGRAIQFVVELGVIRVFLVPNQFLSVERINNGDEG